VNDTTAPTPKKKAKPATPPESPRLMALREMADVPPVDDKAAIEVDISQPIGKLGRELGALLRPRPVFLMNGRIVRVDESTGDVSEMRATKFRSWVEDYAVTGKPSVEGFKTCSMSKETAEGVLASDAFLSCLRELRAVQKVVLPCWNADASGVEWLMPGYHERTGVFTVDLCPYSAAMTAQEARAVLMETYADFPWAADGEMDTSRSFAAHVAACLTAYMLPMWGPELLRMGFLYSANMPGSGKTTLVECALLPVFGHAKAMGWSRNEETLKKELDSKALEGASYIFLDNVKAKLSSDTLDKLITSPETECRLMNRHEMGSAENRRVVFVTANGARTDADLGRRLLQIELHSRSDPGERLATLKRPLCKATLYAPNWRARQLAALRAVVEQWHAAKCPRVAKTRTTFQEWESIMAGILEGIGFANPFTNPIMGTDEQGAAWALFFVRLAKEMETVPVSIFTLTQMVDVARQEPDLMPEMLPGQSDKEGRALHHAIGQHLKRKYAKGGWEFVNEQGLRCEFGKAPDSNEGSRYQIRVLDIPDSE
jgi:hypothetical protein